MTKHLWAIVYLLGHVGESGGRALSHLLLLLLHVGESCGGCLCLQTDRQRANCQEEQAEHSFMCEAHACKVYFWLT